MDKELQHFVGHATIMGGVLKVFGDVVNLEDRGRLVWFKFASPWHVVDVRVAKAGIRSYDEMSDNYSDYDVHETVYVDTENGLEELIKLSNRLDDVLREDREKSSVVKTLGQYTINDILEALSETEKKGEENNGESL